MTRVSQADRMLGLLRDGHWHTVSELSLLGVGRSNSRASDLRRRGHVVDYRHAGGKYAQGGAAHEYRLVSASDDRLEERAEVLPPPSPGGVFDEAAAVAPLAVVPPEPEPQRLWDDSEVEESDAGWRDLLEAGF